MHVMKQITQSLEGKEKIYASDVVRILMDNFVRETRQNKNRLDHVGTDGVRTLPFRGDEKLQSKIAQDSENHTWNGNDLKEEDIPWSKLMTFKSEKAKKNKDMISQQTLVY